MASRLSCALGKRGVYLPVIDGPRMTLPDYRSEVTQRLNVLARTKAKNLLVGGLSELAMNAMIAALPVRRARLVADEHVESLIANPRVRAATPLRWGRDRIGVGLLTALTEQRMIEFCDEPAPVTNVKPRNSHLVICEAGEPISEVIAANYAFAMGAGLHLIDEVHQDECNELLEAFYSLDSPSINPVETRTRLKARLRELCGGLNLPHDGSLTFISRALPFGIAFPELPSTHLFSYPALGIAVANGLAAEQEGVRGTNIAVLVDPEKVKAPEIKIALKMLSDRRVFVRGYVGAGATVRSISEMVELFPYDLLIFATHCGDAAGFRWTYEFTDSEGYERSLVVDIAIGIGGTDNDNILKVVEFMRFHSLDGVDWSDSVAKASLYVGTAIRDFHTHMEMSDLEPVKKEAITRVYGSAAMAMMDNNYIVMPHSLACMGTPIIINNACVSWHELSQRLTYAGARVYIGTLFPISDSEAELIITLLLGKHFGKMLPHALWSAQNAIYGTDSRRPYVITGVYTQRLRVTLEDAPRRIVETIRQAAKELEMTGAGELPSEHVMRRKDSARIFFSREISGVTGRWLYTESE